MNCRAQAPYAWLTGAALIAWTVPTMLLAGGMIGPADRPRARREM